MRDGQGKSAEKRGAAKPAEIRKGRHPPRQGKRRIKKADLYTFSRTEWAKTLALFLALDACISYLFFRSVIAFVLLFAVAPFFLREQKNNLYRKQRREITDEFLDGIQLMLAALQAGYSPENALCEALKELKKIYDADAVIVREFYRMGVQIQMSRNLEDLLLDFGRKSQIPDILSFAEVFLTAKRTGGDLIAVIRNTISCIRQKQETLQEIETCLAGKAMEQNVMSAIPLLILAYVSFSSPGFLDVMYETATGVVTMIVCFVVYLIAYIWGQRIVRIEV